MTSSTTVQCPICNKQVHECEINNHLDNGCQSPNTTITTTTLPAKIQQTFLIPSKKTNDQNSNSPAKMDNNKTILKLGQTNKRKRENLVLNAPLAEKSRPQTWDDFMGQDACKDGTIIRKLIEQDKIPSMILYGPPGCGKTTMARLIGMKISSNAKVVKRPATIHNVQQVRQAGDEARSHLQETGSKGILFLDEIHRFTKAQQDIFLAPVERGDYVFIAATTENPSFRVNNALLSRCHVFLLLKLSEHAILEILNNAIKSHLSKSISIPNEVLEFISIRCDGDARTALNVLENSVSAANQKEGVTIDIAKSALLKSSLLYDRNGEEHYNIISALHKSMRGSDENAALYWLGRMIYAGEDPLYVARRLVRFASEDVGLANNEALPLALSTYQSCQVIGMPECDAILAHCVTYLARSPKSVESYMAMKKVKSTIESHRNYPVPLHIRNAPTTLMQNMNYNQGYIYEPGYENPPKQDFLPPELQHRNFFDFVPEDTSESQ